MDVKTDLQARIKRVQDVMAERGYGGLIIYYGAQHNMLRLDPILLLADFRSLGPCALLLAASGEPTLILSPPWDLARAREEVAFAQVVAVGEHELAAEIARRSKDLAAPLALTGREIMPMGFARALYGQFDTAPVDGDDIVRATAATRTEVELDRITRAAAIADVGFETLQRVAEVGMREYELAAEMEAVMVALGSEDNFGLMAAGAHNIAIRAVTDRRLEEGDVIVGEITPCYKGYFAQLCRTFILGTPTDLQREKYDILLSAEVAGLKAAMPGQPSSGIATAVNQVISDAGYGEYCRQPYMRTRGHGLGMGGVVPFDVTEGSSPTLEPDMTMIIHPNQYIPETGYMMLGDTVVIEAGGPRSLTKTPRQLFSREA
jgi:Xaa-Pro aminopeptidase